MLLVRKATRRGCLLRILRYRAADIVIHVSVLPKPCYRHCVPNSSATCYRACVFDTVCRNRMPPCYRNRVPKPCPETVLPNLGVRNRVLKPCYRVSGVRRCPTVRCFRRFCDLLPSRKRKRPVLALSGVRRCPTVRPCPTCPCY